MKKPALYIVSTALIGGSGSLVAMLFTPRRFALGVALGVLFAVGNLVLLGRIVPTVLAPSPLEEPTPEKQRFWGLVAAFKFLFMLALVGYAMRTDAVDALGIALGTFALPAGLAIASLL
jgi:hypothetical protein